MLLKIGTITAICVSLLIQTGRFFLTISVGNSITRLCILVNIVCRIFDLGCWCTVDQSWVELLWAKWGSSHALQWCMIFLSWRLLVSIATIAGLILLKLMIFGTTFVFSFVIYRLHSGQIDALALGWCILVLGKIFGLLGTPWQKIRIQCLFLWACYEFRCFAGQYCIWRGVCVYTFVIFAGIIVVGQSAWCVLVKSRHCSWFACIACWDLACHAFWVWWNGMTWLILKHFLLGQCFSCATCVQGQLEVLRVVLSGDLLLVAAKD